MTEAGNPQYDRVKELTEQLKALRRGFGVNEATLLANVGPLLRVVSGVLDDDSPWDAREKILTTLLRLANRIKEPDRSIARVSLGFDSEPGLRYTERLGPLEKRFERDTRTIQRRSNVALYRLAECAAAHDTSGRRSKAGPPWHTTVLRISLLLDGPGIEVTESRRIISHRDGLDEIEHSVTVLPPHGTPEGPLDLSTVGIQAISGGEVLSPRLLAKNRAAFGLRPPEPLDEGAEHEFAFRLAVPQMSPLYMCTPNFPCDIFTLHIRFDRAALPTRVWVVDGSLATEADDPTVRRESIPLDASGEVRHTFEDLKTYRSYGLLWEFPAD